MVAKETLPSRVIRSASLSNLEYFIKDELSAETQKVRRGGGDAVQGYQISLALQSRVLALEISCLCCFIIHLCPFSLVGGHKIVTASFISNLFVIPFQSLYHSFLIPLSFTSNPHVIHFSSLGHSFLIPWSFISIPFVIHFYSLCHSFLFPLSFISVIFFVILFQSLYHSFIIPL